MLASELFQTVNLANSIVVSPHLDEEKVEETEMGNTVDLEHGDYAYPPIERKDINRKERLEKANCYLDGNLQSKIVMHLRILNTQSENPFGVPQRSRLCIHRFEYKWKNVKVDLP